jgi:hypothetical protein
LIAKMSAWLAPMAAQSSRRIDLALREAPRGTHRDRRQDHREQGREPEESRCDRSSASPHLAARVAHALDAAGRAPGEPRHSRRKSCDRLVVAAHQQRYVTRLPTCTRPVAATSASFMSTRGAMPK